MKILFLGNFIPEYSSENYYKKTLEHMGHIVITLQEKEAAKADIESYRSMVDLFVWVHTHGFETPNIREALATLRLHNVPIITFHLDLWLGLQRQVEMTEDYFQVDHFFTVDKLMADWINESTKTKGHFLPAGVYEEECFLFKQEPKHDILFVGSQNYHPEYPYRQKLINWLSQTFGNKFKLVTGGVRGGQLNLLYGESKIVIGDTCCLNFNYPYYLSDRIFETTGRGGFIIHPYIKGIEELFIDQEHYASYKYDDFTDLTNKIAFYLQNEAERERIRRSGYLHTKNNHTYRHRWQFILNTVFGKQPPPLL